LPARTIFIDSAAGPARATGYAPRLADALRLAAQAISRAGDVAAAEAPLRDALDAAARGRSIEREAESWLTLLYVVGYRLGRPDEGLGIEPEMADHYNVAGFMNDMLFEHKREIVLVVTHRDAIAALVEELHGSKNIAEIADDDYDDVFTVVIPWFGKVKTLQSRYGEPSPPRPRTDGTD